jgi:transposase
MNATTIAVDLAKHVFEVAMANAQGQVDTRRRLTRAQFARFLREQPAAEVVMEACGTAHYWGRTARACGHEVTLLPPQYVRPFVRRDKTDRADTMGLLDARRSPGIRSVPVKTIAQQELQALLRIRHQWMTTRTARINVLHGLLGELGIAVPKGPRRILARVTAWLEDADAPIPGRWRRALAEVTDEIRDLEARVALVEHELEAAAADDAVVTRLQTVPGVGLLTSTALVATVGHIHAFRRGRCFASWLGITPREHSSGNRRRMGAITKQGNVYVRSLLVHGARAVLAAARRRAQAKQPLTRLQTWAITVADRRGANKATIALANKLARIVWAVWVREVPFTAQHAA